MERETIVCIPGLGGHRSAFKGYAELLSDHQFRYIEVANWKEAFIELKAIVAKEGKVTLLCHCYGTQLGLRLVQAMPGSVSRLVLIEPFFAQLHRWRWPARLINTILVLFFTITDWFGLRRRTFPYKHRIDYGQLAKYPLIFQPFFDMRWQSLTDYFLKTNDLLTFKLPERVTTKTLFVLSPKGYFRSLRDKKRVFRIFENADVAEISAMSHNIISIAPHAVVAPIEHWLKSSQ